MIRTTAADHHGSSADQTRSWSPRSATPASLPPQPTRLLMEEGSVASCSKKTVLKTTVGWDVVVTHTEAHKLGPGTVDAMLTGCCGTKARAILKTLPARAWADTCAIAGRHAGVRALVGFYPPSVVLFPR